ncbi:hypothetical protein HL670_02447 [Serratia plymuthica]|nr:hypothetical protein HL670_02447 [Serratia plymuthica]
MKLTRQQHKYGHKALIFAGAALASVICLFPFYYALITSLRSGAACFRSLTCRVRRTGAIT